MTKGLSSIIIIPGLDDNHKKTKTHKKCHQKTNVLLRKNVFDSEGLLSNYIAAASAVTALGITLHVLCGDVICKVISVFFIILSALYLIVSAIAYYFNTETFLRYHKYGGSKVMPLLAVLQAIVTVTIIFLDFVTNTE